MCRAADGFPSCSCRATRRRMPPPSRAPARDPRRRNTVVARPRAPWPRPARAIARRARHGSPHPTRSARCDRHPPWNPRVLHGNSSWPRPRPTTLRVGVCAGPTALRQCAASSPSSRGVRFAATTRAHRRGAQRRLAPRGTGRSRDGGPWRKVFLFSSPPTARGQVFSQTRPSRASSLSAASGPQLPAS